MTFRLLFVHMASYNFIGYFKTKSDILKKVMVWRKGIINGDIARLQVSSLAETKLHIGFFVLPSKLWVGLLCKRL